MVPEDIAARIISRNHEARRKAASVTASIVAAISSETQRTLDAILDEIAPREPAESRGEDGEDPAVGEGAGTADA